MPVRVDAYASEPQYREHIEPVFDALGDMRGEWRRHGSDPVIVAAFKDLLGVGDRPVIFMEHGAGQTYGKDHPSYAGGRGRENVVLFLCPSEHVAALNRERWPAVPSVAIGCPKLDRYVDVKPEGLVGCAFHWNANVCPEARSALSHWVGHLEGVDIGTAHPRIARAARKVYDDAGIRWVDADEMFRTASLLVADNTSLGWEFIALGRPVVWLNAPWYRRNVEHGLRFWDYAEVQVDEPPELPGAIMLAERTSPDVGEVLYGKMDGHATARAVAAVKEFDGNT